MTSMPMRGEGAGDADAWTGLPPQVQPSDCGLLLEGHPRTADVAALLVQLAVDGHLTIDPMTSKAGGRAAEREGRAARRTGWRLRRTDRDIADPVGRRFLDDVFGEQTDVTLARARLNLGGARRRQLGRAWDRRARELGWARADSAVVVARVVQILGVVLFALVALIPLATSMEPPQPYASVAWILFALAAGWATIRARRPRVRRLTDEGRELGDRLRSLGARLSDGDRALSGPDGAAVFSRHLPWAVALGVADRWCEAFAAATGRALAGGGAEADGFEGWSRRWAHDLRWCPALGAPLVAGGAALSAADLGSDLRDLTADLGAFAAEVPSFASRLGDMSVTVGGGSN